MASFLRIRRQDDSGNQETRQLPRRMPYCIIPSRYRYQRQNRENPSAELGFLFSLVRLASYCLVNSSPFLSYLTGLRLGCTQTMLQTIDTVSSRQGQSKYLGSDCLKVQFTQTPTKAKSQDDSLWNR